MAYENLSKYYPIVINSQGIFSYMRTRALLILDPIRDQSIRLAVHGPKVGHNELDCARVSGTESYRVSQLRVVQ